MRCLFSLIAIVLCVASARSDDVATAAAKAKAALALSKCQRDRAAAAACESKAKALLALIKAQRDRLEPCMEDIAAAMEKGRAEKRPLFVWVGMECQKDVRDAFPQAVHCHVEANNGDATPRLLVEDKARGDFRPFKGADIGTPTIPAIRKILDATGQRSSMIAVPVANVAC